MGKIETEHVSYFECFEHIKVRFHSDEPKPLPAADAALMDDAGTNHSGAGNDDVFADDHHYQRGRRGSGSGSLVNYLLGITQIDPLPYGLLWSRFLGRHRTSWPDIDTDAGDRDALIDASRELFGDDAVIPVSNFNTLKLKSLVKDIAKFYGIDFTEVNKMTGPLQDEVMPHAKDENQEKS